MQWRGVSRLASENVPAAWWPDILDTIQEGVEVSDAEDKVIWVNAAFTKITGLSSEQRVGRPPLDFMNGEGPRSVGQQALGNGRVPGTDIEVLVIRIPVAGATAAARGGMVTIIQDVSRLLQLSRDLTHSSTMVDNLYETIGDLTRATYTFTDLIGNSPALLDAIKMARRAAQSDSTVLITGESGTGKELFAHAIHNASRRRGGSFLSINCAAIPDQLLESEVFGYEKGAFTGAVKRKLGMFELANHGTIFLDEIGDMSLALQAKFLRVLQEQAFHRLGGTRPVRTNVRVIAATNNNLSELVAAGRFRSDLFYRLNVVRIQVPPLRERLGDIPRLTQHIVTRLNRKLGRAMVGVSDEVLRAMSKYHWPGNVRELENVIERAMNMLDIRDRLIGRELLQSLGIAPEVQPAASGVAQPGSSDVRTLEAMEREMVRRTLAEFGQTSIGKRQAADSLGISLATLYNKIKKYGLA